MTGRERRAGGAGRATAKPRAASVAYQRASPKSLPDGDDGRTIVDMNVEGMPWYAPERPGAPRRGAGEEAPRREDIPLTREQSRFFTWGALKAALLVTGAMCLGIILFVLFCQFVWFR